MSRRAVRAPRVLFATAEYAPLVRVGGLGFAAAGLVAALRRSGCEVEVVVPDYGTTIHPLRVGPDEALDLPDWAPPSSACTVELDEAGPVTFVRSEPLRRPHPYNDDTGEAWPDNDLRFFGFSAAVAALARTRQPDVVHVNDWHTAAAIAWLPPAVRSVLTIHNLGYQGWAEGIWLERFGTRANRFARNDSVNPLAGAVELADRVVAVSPTYAAETRTARFGCGLEVALVERGDAYVGIRNGIDTIMRDPALDPLLPASYDHRDLSGKDICRKQLLIEAGLDDDKGPVIGFLGRFVEQKGVDLAVGLGPFLDRLPARLVLGGRGEHDLEWTAHRAAAERPDQVAYVPRSDDEFGHLLVAGADILVVPSRFEPCGLTQMEAMACGTIPVVTGVGGLRDTVVDQDAVNDRGNGFVADMPDPAHLLDAVHRAVRAWSNRRRRRVLQQRGMTADWSWTDPAAAYLDLYDQLTPRR